MSTDDRVAVTTGIARLHASPGLAGPGRLGLVTNHTGVLPDLRPAAPALLAAGVRLVALFGPEHGLHGTGQAGESEDAERDPATGLPVHDTYRCDGERLDQLLRASGVDALVYDLQDIGARFYTYVWTMYDLMVSAARTGVRFVVADRPNPLGGLVSEGPLLDPEWASFVGRAATPVRHGLTCGELARLLNTAAVPRAAGRAADLTVIETAGWRRHMDAGATGLPWVAPSPNIPTPATAAVYPGTCLFEGTNLSEGRGTTQPFEIVGAPWIDARFAPSLAALALPGVRFRELRYVPAFHKHAGRPLRGVQLHVTDRASFAPVRTAVAMLAVLRRLYPDDFAWRGTDDGTGDGARADGDTIDGAQAGGDTGSGADTSIGSGADTRSDGGADPSSGGGAARSRHRPFIDLLWGSDRLRRAIDAGDDPLPLCDPPSPPRRWAGDDVLLYS
ncbi:exo-beta-N-acetylmuramidase NamZ domain-containing protein [Streptomyces sp. NPDC090108]|uniref:exo-beta-N-acetylmuramidase NamZ family protein n=1 Tax=Streptomyces sp. NPDC090108 TaxID=3365947 RepID=UPI003826A03F